MNNNHPNRRNVPDQYRQGDVLAVAVKFIPTDARETKRDEHGRIVLAYGEVTGHAHAFRGKGICGFTKLDNNEVEYLLIESGGGGKTLNHEYADGRQAEHAPHTWPDGKYELADQVSYTPTELIRERD